MTYSIWITTPSGRTERGRSWQSRKVALRVFVRDYAYKTPDGWRAALCRLTNGIWEEITIASRPSESVKRDE